MQYVRQLYALLGFVGNAHFAYFVLGGSTVIAVVVTALVGFVSALDGWMLVALFVGLLLIGIAALDLVGKAVLRRLQPTTTALQGAPRTFSEAELTAARLTNTELAATIAEQSRATDSLRAASENAPAQVGRARVSPPPSAAWMPIDGDLSTFAMTRDDLEGAFSRAREKATAVLAPDAQVELERVSLLPAPVLTFGAWSQIAHKYTWIHVYERYEYANKPKSGSLYLSTDTGMDATSMVKPNFREAYPPPWRNSDDWSELVKQSWYRVRPFDGTAELTFSRPPLDDPGWGTSYMTFDDGDGRKQMFSLRNGTVDSFEWPRDVGV